MSSPDRQTAGSPLRQQGAAPATGTGRPVPVFAGGFMPWGVGVLGALSLLAHLLMQLPDERTGLEILWDFAVVPVRWAAQLSGLHGYPGWASAALPLVSHQILHAGLIHLVMNMMLLVMAGPVAERAMAGPAAVRAGRFLAFAFLCGAIGGLGFAALNWGSETMMFGASGAVSGVFGGFLWAGLRLTRSSSQMRRAVVSSGLWFVGINIGLMAVGRLMGLVPVAWESHLFGFLAGLALYPLFAGPRPGPAQHEPGLRRGDPGSGMAAPDQHPPTGGYP
jgi:membrane associated rhomboid family serine protease